MTAERESQRPNTKDSIAIESLEQFTVMALALALVGQDGALTMIDAVREGSLVGVTKAGPLTDADTISETEHTDWLFSELAHAVQQLRGVASRLPTPEQPPP